MKSITGLLAGLSLSLLAATPAMAQDDEAGLAPFFIGIDYTFGNATFFDTQDRTTGICGTQDLSCDRIKYRPHAARVNVGMNLGENFVLQAAYGRGNGEENGTAATSSAQANNTRVALKSFYGVYARASTPLQGFGGLRIGGILGYSNARVEATPIQGPQAGQTVDESVSGPSFGVELSMPIFGSSLIVADWMSLVDEDRVRISTANLGFRFGVGGGGEDDDDF